MEVVAFLVLLSLASLTLINLDLGVTVGLTEFLIAFCVSFFASLFVHESIHYVTNSLLGYDPVYIWPNKVIAPNVHVNLRHIIPILFAPQLLSLVYVGILLIGVGPVLTVIATVGFAFNLIGGRSDMVWIALRLTWPKGTRVVVNKELTTYVAFPKESA